MKKKSWIKGTRNQLVQQLTAKGCAVVSNEIHRFVKEKMEQNGISTTQDLVRLVKEKVGN